MPRTRAKLTCPLCRHTPLAAEGDTEGWPIKLVCEQCGWLETNPDRCKTLASHQWQVQTALHDPAERKRRQTEERKAKNAAVLRSYRLK